MVGIVVVRCRSDIARGRGGQDINIYLEYIICLDIGTVDLGDE
jgi:hypothetical protein